MQSVLSALERGLSVLIPPPRAPHSKSQIALYSLLSVPFWGQRGPQLGGLP